MIRYLLGALAGGVLGYAVLYRLIGCSTGACPITANPYLSTIMGLVLGALLAGSFGGGPKAQASQSAAPSASGSSQAAAYKKISAKEAKARMESGADAVILDVRTLAEYNEGHIAGALLIPNETIAGQRPALLPDLNAEILVYCRSGSRSSAAARKLIALGYTNVSDFGGIIDWPYETVKGK